jgi:putative transposase
METWRAGCGESRTSGSEGGPEKPTDGNARTALRSDPYTYISTWSGFLLPGRGGGRLEPPVIGWSTANHLRTELVLEALNMALWQRRPKQVIHHSDQGSQYTSIGFGKRCRQAGVRPSMGSVVAVSGVPSPMTRARLFAD